MLSEAVVFLTKAFVCDATAVITSPRVQLRMNTEHNPER